MKVTYHQDPGHGWLVVSREMLQQLGIEKKITSYSYARGKLVFLEEDCDAVTFMLAAADAGFTVELVAQHVNHNSPVRSYARYEPA